MASKWLNELEVEPAVGTVQPITRRRTGLTLSFRVSKVDVPTFLTHSGSIVGRGWKDEHLHHYLVRYLPSQHGRGRIH